MSADPPACPSHPLAKDDDGASGATGKDGTTEPQEKDNDPPIKDATGPNNKDDGPSKAGPSGARVKRVTRSTKRENSLRDKD